MQADELRSYLDEALLTGEVLTGRDSNYGNLRRLADRDEYQLYGIELEERWTFGTLLRLMVDLVGIDPDEDWIEGQDTIDGDKTIAKLIEYRDRFRRAITDDELFLFATAHPGTLAPFYARLAAAVRERGGRVLDLNTLPFAEPGAIRVALADPHEALWHTAGVTTLYRAGNLMHTHSPAPMNALLDALEAHAADSGEEIVPTFVVADHGWACAAGRRGYPVIAIADCNDPAVFVAEAQGSVEITVPIDDGLAVHLYEPVLEFLLAPA